MSAISSTHSTNILDTFKLDQDGIFLKTFHLERTLAAINLVIKDPNVAPVLETYDLIEKWHRDGLTQRVRIVFNSMDLSYEYSLHALESIAQPVLLDVIQTMHQPSGLGVQNYKWEKRDYWEKILMLKNSRAADIISLNELGNCVETSRHNLFFYDPQINSVVTPSLASGCISGVYRQWVLSTGGMNIPGLGFKSIRESEIHFTELAHYQLFVANSVRGVLPAGLAT